MIDAKLLPAQRRLMAAPARFFIARGIGADQISMTGFALGLLAVPALAFGLYHVALTVLLLTVMPVLPFVVRPA